VVGPALEVVEVLDDAGAINDDAKDGAYDQFQQVVTQTSFPDPRGNLDELDIQESTIRAFLTFGGAMYELDNGDSLYGTYGSSFLAFANSASRAAIIASGPENYAFGAGLLLAFCVDNPLRTDTSSDITVELTGTLTAEDTADEINAAAGETIAYSIEVAPGDTRLVLVSNTYGAGSSLTIRASSGAAGILYSGLPLSGVEEYRIEGCGFRGQDDGDVDTTTPWIEFFRGEEYMDGVAAGAAAWQAEGNLRDELDVFTNARAAARTYSGVSPDVPLQAATAVLPGDIFYADGAQVGTTAEVIEVQQDRFRLGVLDSENSVFDDDGVPTSRVYTEFEVGNLFDGTPLAPQYCWFGAQGLVEGNIVPTPVAAALTGSTEASAALFGYLVGGPVATANFPLLIGNKRLYLRATVDGVRGAEQTVLFSGTFNSMADVAAAITAQATDIIATSYTDVTAAEQYLTLQTGATGADQAVEVSETGAFNAVTDLEMDAASRSGGSGVGVDAEFSTQAFVTGGPDDGETPGPYVFPLVGGELLDYTVTDRNGTTLSLAYTLDAADVGAPAANTWAGLAAHLNAGGNGTALPANGMPNCPMVEFIGDDTANARGLTIRVLEGGSGTAIDVDEATTHANFSFAGARVAATADIVIAGGDPGAAAAITVDTTELGGAARVSAAAGGGPTDWVITAGDIPATIASLAAGLSAHPDITAVDNGVDTVTVTVATTGWRGNLCTIVSSDFTNMTIQGGAVIAFLTGGTATSTQTALIGPATAGGDILTVDTAAVGGSQVDYEAGGVDWVGNGAAGASSLVTAINTGPQNGEVYAHNLDAVGAAQATVTLYALNPDGYLATLCWAQTTDFAQINVAGAGDLLEHEFTGGTEDNDNDTGADVLTGEEFAFQLDYNPHEWVVTPANDSLDDLIEMINEEVNDNIVATAGGTNTRQLVLTSLLLGQASRVEVLADTASRIITSAALGMATPNHEADGSGRPNPDFYLDLNLSVVIGAQILRDTVTGIPFDNDYLGTSDIYLQYHALRLDLSPSADSPALLIVEDTTTLESILDPLTADNPLGLGLFFAKLNAPGVSVAGLGVDEVTAAMPEGTLTAYTQAAEFLESEEVYALAPLTHEEVVHQLFKTHVDYMSGSDLRGERIVFINPEVPDEEAPTTAASGTDGNSTGADNQFIVDENPHTALVAAGVANPAVMPVSDGVYLEITVGGEQRRYNLSAINGALVTINLTFAAGENDDSFYSTETLLAGLLISVDWAIKVRGDALVVAGVSDLDGIATAVATVASTYADRRVYYVFPDSVTAELDAGTAALPAYYACCAIAGMVGQLVPQQGFTNYPMTGFTGVTGSNDIFKDSLLDEIAGGGVYILIQEADGAPVICRHQLSTDVTSIETRELSITKVVDFTAKTLRTGLRNFLGIYNITPAFMDTLTTVVDGMLDFLKQGGVLIGASLNSISQDTTNPDTVLIDVTLEVPYPCNYIRVTLVV